MVDEEDEKICIIAYEYSCSVDSSIHCFLYYQEIGITSGVVYLTVFLLQVSTEHIDESLLVGGI